MVFYFPHTADNSPVNLTVTVELSAKSFPLSDLSSLSHDPVASKRLKLVIRWLHPSAGNYYFFDSSYNLRLLLECQTVIRLSIVWLLDSKGEPPEGYNVEVRPSAVPLQSTYSIGDLSVCTEHFTDFFHHVEYSVSLLFERIANVYFFFTCAQILTSFVFSFAKMIYLAICKEPPVIEVGSSKVSKDSQLIQFGCSYIISIQASPIIPPARPQVINFTVPGVYSRKEKRFFFS